MCVMGTPPLTFCDASQSDVVSFGAKSGSVHLMLDLLCESYSLTPEMLLFSPG